MTPSPICLPIYLLSISSQSVNPWERWSLQYTEECPEGSRVEWMNKGITSNCPNLNPDLKYLVLWELPPLPPTPFRCPCSDQSPHSEFQYPSPQLLHSLSTLSHPSLPLLHIHQWLHIWHSNHFWLNSLAVVNSIMIICQHLILVKPNTCIFVHVFMILVVW